MFDGRRGETQRRICREPENGSDHSCPGLATLAIDLLRDLLGTALLLTGRKILW
jgi:hypothetical protein